MTEDRKEWTLNEWNRVYGRKDLPAMNHEEIQTGIDWLRDHSYPEPKDCPKDKCPKWRPACRVGVCRIAVGMCGDF